MMIATFLTRRFCYKCLVKELQCQPRTPLLFEQPSWQATPIMNLGNNSTDVTKNSRNVTKNKLRSQKVFVQGPRPRPRLPTIELRVASRLLDFVLR